MSIPNAPRQFLCFLIAFLHFPIAYADRELTEDKAARELFQLNGEDNILGEDHLGIVNGKMSVGIIPQTSMHIQGLFAPPYVSSDFSMRLLIDGNPCGVNKWSWLPSSMFTECRIGDTTMWVESRLMSHERAMWITCAFSASKVSAPFECALEVAGTLDTNLMWEFAAPKSERKTTIQCDGHTTTLQQGDIGIAIQVNTSDAKWDPTRHAVCWKHTPESGQITEVSIALAIGKVTDAVATVNHLTPDDRDKDYDEYCLRVKTLTRLVPTLSSDNRALEKLYNRSLVHALTNRWDVPEFKLHPYYSTGSVKGGCVCDYLWDFGEVWEIMPLIDPEALKSHVKQFLSIDLTKHFAFLPITGEGFGPWYMVNQEKIIGLIYYYVMETGDSAFLNDTVNGKTILDYALENATFGDDASKPVALIDYGASNSHLELRKQYAYNHVMPDLNGRRYNNYVFAARLSEMMGKPRPDLIERADALKKVLHEQLWDPRAKWFAFRNDKGEKELRYTCQMFKLFNSPVLTDESLQGLLSHWNTKDFLGDYGLHSIAKGDPAYDENDVDNGGPGACTCFPPQIMERLYKSGHAAEADELLKRVLWWGEKLPYWGDSLYADRPDYRKDTPLQCAIDGLTVAQMMIFGLFGITPNADGTVTVNPHLPPFATTMALKNVKMRGHSFDVSVESNGFSVTESGETKKSSFGSAIMLRK